MLKFQKAIFTVELSNLRDKNWGKVITISMVVDGQIFASAIVTGSLTSNLR